MKKYLALAAVAAIGFSTTAYSADLLKPAPAVKIDKGHPSVEIGSLSCDLIPDYNYVVAAAHQLNCVFKGARGSRIETYTGSINNVGVSLGPVTSGTLVWGVFSPKVNLQPGALAGNYGGVSAGVTLGVGAQANVLLGGFNRSIALQPISLQGQKGLNVTAGITGLRLTRH